MKDNDNVLHPNAEVSRNVTDYCAKHSDGIPQYMQDFHAEASANHPRAEYMISPVQAAWQIWMAKALGAKRVLEIGCFIGFSAMGWAEAVGEDGHVTTLEFEPEYAQAARTTFEHNNIKNVEVITGDAKASLKKMSETITEPYDLIFIDADKISYPAYLTQILEHSPAESKVRLLRSGGVILADNVLRRGLVADSSKANPWADKLLEKFWKAGDMEGLQKFNDMMFEEPRLETFLLAMYDGVGMARLKN